MRSEHHTERLMSVHRNQFRGAIHLRECTVRRQCPSSQVKDVEHSLFDVWPRRVVAPARPTQLGDLLILRTGTEHSCVPTLSLSRPQRTPNLKRLSSALGNGSPPQPTVVATSGPPQCANVSTAQWSVDGKGAGYNRQSSSGRTK